jgi:hypothetical protein
MSKHSALPSLHSPTVTHAELRLTNLPPSSSKASLQRWLQKLLSSVRWRSDGLRTTPERAPLHDAMIKVVAADLEEALALLRSRQYQGRQLVVEERAASRMDRSALRFYITNVSARTTAAQLEQHVAQVTRCTPIAVSIHAGSGAHAGISNFAFVGMPVSAKDLAGRVHGSLLNDRRLVCKLSDDRSYVPGKSGVSSPAYRSPRPQKAPPPPPVIKPATAVEPLSPEEPPQPSLSVPISPVSAPTEESTTRPPSACASYSSTSSAASSASNEPTPPGGMQYDPPVEESKVAVTYLPAVPAKNLEEYAAAAAELGRVFSTLAELEDQRGVLEARRIECDKEIERLHKETEKLHSVSRKLREAESDYVAQVDSLQRRHALLSEFLFGSEGT